MKYLPPFGVSDPEGHYINGNSQTGVQGSIPPAGAFEDPMRELVNLIEYSGFTPDEDDLEQVTQAVRSQRLNYAADTGAVNALAVAYDPAIVSFNVGLILRVKVAITNTSAATIAVDSMPATAIKRANGAALSAGDLVAGEVATLVYDGTYFQVVNFIGLTAETENNNYYTISIPYTTDSGTPNTITATFSPVITSLAAGDLIEVKMSNANTGATTITVNALPSKNVISSNLEALVANQLIIGMIALLVYDGTQFQLINPAKPKVSTGGGGVVQIKGRSVYQDANYHISTQRDVFVEAFRVSYTPVGAGNKIRVQVNGATNQTADITPERKIHGYLAYSTDGGTTWNPSSWPGYDFPTVGTFTANPFMTELQTDDVQGLYSLDHNFSIISDMTIPAGPPASVIFKLMFTSPAGALQTWESAVLHGGTMVEIIEFETT